MEDQNQREKQIIAEATDILVQKIDAHKVIHNLKAKHTISKKEESIFRKWPFSGEDDRGKTSPRALVFTRCDIQSERL
jgi:hypothetical protein